MSSDGNDAGAGRARFFGSALDPSFRVPGARFLDVTLSRTLLVMSCLSPRASWARPGRLAGARASPSPRRARAVRARRVAPRATPSDSDAADAADADVPEGYSDRANLGKRYYEGFLKSSLGESDSVQTENRDTITASVKLGVQATGVLAVLMLGFMASNGLL